MSVRSLRVESFPRDRQTAVQCESQKKRDNLFRAGTKEFMTRSWPVRDTCAVENLALTRRMNFMERREFLRFAFGVAAGASAIAAASAATAAPMLVPQNDLTGRAEPDMAAQPAMADQNDLANAKVEQVRWHRRRGHWHRRRYWRRRRW